MNWIKQSLIISIVILFLLGALEIGARIFYTGNTGFSLNNFLQSKPEPFHFDEDFDIIVKWFNKKCKSCLLYTSDAADE